VRGEFPVNVHFTSLSSFSEPDKDGNRYLYAIGGSMNEKPIKVICYSNSRSDFEFIPAIKTGMVLNLRRVVCRANF
jgi:hypothetical protein